MKFKQLYIICLVILCLTGQDASSLSVSSSPLSILKIRNEIYTVKYSNMISNTEDEITKLLNYCELPFESQCLEFYKSKRPVKTPSAEQVRQPIYKSGLDYWKNFEEDLNPLEKLFSSEIEK